MSWPGWRRLRRFPTCDEPACTFLGRLCHSLCWWNRKVLLHGRTYCGPQCFERAVGRRFEEVCDSRLLQWPVQHRIPLGLLMLSRGQLTSQQLQSALDAQRESGRERIGEWLQRLGFASEQQVTAALGLQWSCPVYTAPGMVSVSPARMLPYRLLEEFRMCPIGYVPATRMLYVSFCDRVDYVALYAIEQMLECQTEACLVSSRCMNEFLEHVGRMRGPGDMLFESWHNPRDMARITCAQVLEFGVDQVRVSSCGQYVWTRLIAGQESTNLLFRHPANPSAPALTPALSRVQQNAAKVLASRGR
jgi:hypothetical protein